MIKMLERMGLNTVTRCFPKSFWKHYDQKSRRLGLKRLYLILSFDCDTPEDIEAAEQLNVWLYKHHIKATYAVPGKQLEYGSEVYRRLAETGADFINHGSNPHTEWRENRYWSINFYNQMSYEEVVEDIRLGHEMVKKVTGRMPTGFRTPHFGLFQERKQLEQLHHILKELGYRYSTSTLPRCTLFHGPIWDRDGLWEIPLSGTYHSFLSLLDSWGYVISPHQPIVRDEYADIFIQTVDRLLSLGVSGVLNYYIDPSHVYKSQSFYRALEYVVERHLPTLHYGELLNLIRKDKP
jgi:hypothetical protein